MPLGARCSDVDSARVGFAAVLLFALAVDARTTRSIPPRPGVFIDSHQRSPLVNARLFCTVKARFCIQLTCQNRLSGNKLAGVLGSAKTGLSVSRDSRRSRCHLPATPRGST